MNAASLDCLIASRGRFSAFRAQDIEKRRGGACNALQQPRKLMFLKTFTQLDYGRRR